ncbi:MAG: hypothetical protein FJ387_07750 [Verrucomicrobia bacterium]|nr:hypothetical protein [Verrucomicrobiota bacterium]
MTDAQIRKGRGCFFYGCLAVVVLVLVGLLTTYFGFRYAVGKFADAYTETAPVALPKVELSAAEALELQQRVKAFKTAVDNGTAAEPLVLNERELNGLIATSPDLAEIKDRVYLSLEGDQVTGQVSIPLDKFPLARLRGRYLNGSATFAASLENGVLIVTLQSLDVKGQAVPEAFLMQMRKENLAKDAYRNPEAAAWIRKLDRLAIQDGRVTIAPRQP